MQPLSNDLRERILKAVDNREGSRRGIAARFCVICAVRQFNASCPNPKTAFLQMCGLDRKLESSCR